MQSEQQQRIMGYFIEEAKDHLETIEKGLLKLQETIGDPDRISEVFRAAHSVKGGAAMLGLDSIQHTSHRLEDYFKVLKECPIQVDQKLETLFLRVFDTLQDLLEQLQGPFGLTQEKAAEIMQDVDPIFGELHGHLNGLVTAAGGEPLTPLAHSPTPEAKASPSASPALAPKVDALQQFFKATVAKQLKGLLALFKQADTPDSRQQLQTICQALLSEGQTVGVPDPWQELVRLSQSAIAYPENTYRQLAPIVIKSLKQAQVLGLADKGNEIKPEPSLLNLQPPDDPVPDIVLDEETSIDDLLADVSRDADQVLDSVLENELTLDSSGPDLDISALEPLETSDRGASDREASGDRLPSVDENLNVGSGANHTANPGSDDEASDLSDLLGIGSDLADDPWDDPSGDELDFPSGDELDLKILESNGTGSNHNESEELSLVDSFDLIDSISDSSATDSSLPSSEGQGDLMDALGLEDETDSSGDRIGPQVGPDEMDSLADLFAGDPDNLNIDWPETDDEPKADDLSDELTLDASNDFSDLLFEPDNSDEDTPQDLTADDDDISALLNTLENSQGDEEELATTPFDSPSESDPPLDFDDSFTESDSPLDTDGLDTSDLGDLFNEPIAADNEANTNSLNDSDHEDIELDSNGLGSLDDPALDADPQTALTSDSQLDNLGAFFGGDEDLELGTEGEDLELGTEGEDFELGTEGEDLLEDQLATELSSQDFDELFVGLDAEETIFEEQDISEDLGSSVGIEFAAHELPETKLDDDPPLAEEPLASADEDVLSDLWAEESEPTLRDPILNSPLTQESLDTAESLLGLDGNDELFDHEPVSDTQPAPVLETDIDIEAEVDHSSFDSAHPFDQESDLSSPDSSAPDWPDEAETTSKTPSHANNVLDSLFGAPSPQEALTVDDPFDINDPPLDTTVSDEADNLHLSPQMDEQIEVDDTQDMVSSLGIDDTDFLGLDDDGDEDGDDSQLTSDLATDFLGLDDDGDDDGSDSQLTSDLATDFLGLDEDGDENGADSQLTFDGANDGADSQLTSDLDDVLDGIFDQGGGEPIITDPDMADIALSEDDETANLTDMFMQDVVDDASVTTALVDDELEFGDFESEDANTPDGETADGETAFSELDVMLNDVSAQPELEDNDSVMNELERVNELENVDDLGNSVAAPIRNDANVELDVNGNSDQFSELETLLAEESAFPEVSPDIPSSDHLDSEPLVGMGDDDFADLDALLSEDGLDDTDSANPVASLAGSDTDFSDLEKLLEDADSLGGPSITANDARQASSPQRRPARRGFSNQTMRVSVKNLDNLNNLVGELVVNRNSLEQSQERLRQFLDNLLYQVQQLSDVGQRMRDLYERSLLESSLLSSRRSYQPMSARDTSSADSSHATGASFDALEMDRFTGFHTLSQEMIELIVRVRESASDIDFVVDESDQVTRMFRQVTTQLQEGLTRTRMVPFAQAADRLPRAVRDISIKCGKQAKLVVEGRDTLIDKMILEQLYDPMTHLVNNAITHGIEAPDARVEKSKNAVGTITIRSFHQGNQTIISVTDDGGGIDPDIVSRKAIEKGLITTEEAQEMSRLDIYDLLFHHGFSTRDKADDFAGRGVGMDVVRTSLGEIRGVVNIDSAIDQGTTFTIRLPLTLSISKALLCVSNRARIAFPMDGVEDMLDVPQDRIQADDQGRPAIMWRDILLPFRPLSDLLKFHRSLGRGSVYGGGPEDDVISVVVLRSAGNYLALQVDQVLGEQEIVIKQLEAPIPKPTGIAGATVLGDGRIMPIADVLELIDLSMGRIRRDAGNLLWEQEDVSVSDAALTASEPTVLIVDDSITVRELLSMTFNKVGYRVEQARDGQEAWEKLRSGLPCDLVFCDIEMPRMDGLELLSRLQKDSHFSELPIAMLTSRGADRHRQMAVQLGAKGYFTKPYLEEALLDAAQRMLKGEVLVGAEG